MNWWILLYVVGIMALTVGTMPRPTARWWVACLGLVTAVVGGIHWGAQ